MNRSAASRRPSLRPVARLALLIVLLLVVAGCDEAPPTFQVREPALQVRTINGHAVPAFPTPEEQLAYTRSSFTDLDEERAALEAVALLFPDAEQQEGEAALELAYLQLGPDYRLASTEARQAAIAAYQAIIKTHGRFPAIAARAQWYVGWIACTLLDERQRGLAAFRAVVEQYPQVERTTAPGMPLVSLAEPSAEAASPAGGEVRTFWADLALLAIVRCADGERTAHEAMLQLRQRDPQGRCTGLALRELLRRAPAVTETIGFAHEYLQGSSAHPSIEEDLRALLHEDQPVAPLSRQADNRQ